MTRDASESARKALQAVSPEQTPFLTEDFTDNEIANQLFNELLEEKRKIKTHQQLFDELKHQLQNLITDAKRGIYIGGAITWKKAQDSISLVSNALLKQHPEYLEQFPQTKVGARRFQIYPNGD